MAWPTYKYVIVASRTHIDITVVLLRTNLVNVTCALLQK
jgi:hypothetical protein